MSDTEVASPSLPQRFYRWQPEHQVGGWSVRPFFATGSWPSLLMSGWKFMSVTVTGSPMYGAALRWHSRHQPIDSGWTWRTRGIWSTRPWQFTQPTPAARCAEWLK